MESNGTTFFNYRLYGNAVEFEPLPAEEQVRLVKLYRKNKSKKIIDQLVNTNIRFIMSEMKRYRNRGVPDEDLISAACVGFIKAIGKYKYNRNMSLVNYSKFWIKNALTTVVANETSLIKVTPDMWRTFSELGRLEREGKTDRQICIEMDLSYQKLNQLRARRLASDTSSYRIGTEVIDGEDLTFDLGMDDPAHEILMDKDDLSAAIKLVEQLEGKERDVLIKHFGLDGNKPMIFDEISQLYGVTRQRIQQIEVIALYKLKRLAAKQLKDRMKQRRMEQCQCLLETHSRMSHPV